MIHLFYVMIGFERMVPPNNSFNRAAVAIEDEPWSLRKTFACAVVRPEAPRCNSPDRQVGVMV